METLASLVAVLSAVVDASDHMYLENGGEPTETSIASNEVADHDDDLAAAIGTARPLFGAYADAEAKLRVLNDLVRSFVLLVESPDVQVGHVVVGRVVIETAARVRWGLAVGGDYRERAARSLRERLRTIEEIKKFGSESKLLMEQQGEDKLIRDNASTAGLAVPGPPPAAIDLVWPLLSAVGSPLRVEGLDREMAMTLFYRFPSAQIHGAPHGVAPHFAEPGTDPSARRTRPEPREQTIILMGATLNCYVNAQRALIDLYGWDTVRWDKATAIAADHLATGLDEVRM